MSESIGQAFLDFFGNPYVATFLIAILPIVELRGAIPVGYLYFNSVSPIHMNWFGAFSMGFLGSAIVVPIILLALIPILNWLKRTKLFAKPANWLDNRFSKKADKLKEKAILKAQASITNEEHLMTDEEKAKVALSVDKKIFWAKFIGVFTFVAIPLPLTGVWTGSAVAAFLKMDFKHATIAVLLGNLVAAIIVTILTVIFGGIFL